MGRPKDPGYWRKWRAAHPEYRKRERARSKARPVKSHGDRKAQYQRRRQRVTQATGDNGWVETQHPLMDEAASVTQRHIKPDRRTYYLDPLYEECLMEAALALVEGSDPDVAVVATLRRERLIRSKQAPLYDVEDAA